MVRHEAAEAAGAVGCPGAWQLVEEHLADATREVAETCQLAVQRMAWYDKKQAEEEEEKRTQEAGQQQQHMAAAEEGGESEKAVVIKRYLSVDPAPPAAPGTPTERLVAALLDESAETPIFDRYRALFSLRDAGGAPAVSALCAALRGSTSALLKHEVAYVLGQMQDPASLGALRECLLDAGEHPMVRHEAAEALGALGAEAAAPAEPFSLPPPPAALLLPLPTGDTCAEMACSECQIEAARRVSLRSSEASVGTNSCFFFSPEGREV